MIMDGVASHGVICETNKRGEDQEEVEEWSDEIVIRRVSLILLIWYWNELLKMKGRLVMAERSV